ncbi:hypothetical protein MRX96_032371 [Rhipicephalus microplus]
MGGHPFRIGGLLLRRSAVVHSIPDTHRRSLRTEAWQHLLQLRREDAAVQLPAKASRTVTLRSSQSSNSKTSTGPTSSETGLTLSTTPDSPTPPELALTPFSSLLGDLQEIPDEVSATTGTPSPTPSEASTARSKSSCASLFSQDGNVASIPPSPRQHESPQSDADHGSPRRSRPPSPKPAHPPLLGSIAGSHSQNSRDVTTPSATSEEESSPEGSGCYSLLQQDPDAGPATPRTSEQGALHHDTAWQRHRRILDQVLQPGASPTASTPPTQLTSSERTSLDNAGSESHDPTPQTENPGEINLSRPINHTSVLAEHTQQIRQLVREPATAER